MMISPLASGHAASVQHPRTQRAQAAAGASSIGSRSVVVAAARKLQHAAPLAGASSSLVASRGGAVVARSASAEAPVDVELLRAEEVRIQMAKAMNATVLRINVPEYKTSPGNWLAVVGSLDELGSWQPSAAARLKWLPGHEWVGDVVLPEHYSGAFEYKLVLMNDKGLCVWEPGTNRKLSVTDSFTDHEEKTVEVVLQWGLRDPEFLVAAEQEYPDEVLEDMLQRAEQAVASMPGLNAATVLLQAQQQLSESKRRHREQVTDLRSELVHLQESSRRETKRVQSRMRELEHAMEKIQARLEKERLISEAHIALLKRRIAEKDFASASARRAAAAAVADYEEEVAAAAHEEQEHREAAPARQQRRALGGRQASEEAAEHDISEYEMHVMSILPNYSGLSLERLHTMLGQSVLMPRYKRGSSGELAQLLTRLVADNKITVDNGVYRYRSRDGSVVGSRRTRTPRAASPTPARSSSSGSSAAPASAKVVTVDARLLELEPAVMTCLGSTTGLTLERLHAMLASVAPQASCTTQSLAALMAHLEVQGKVYKDRGQYRYGKATARARSPQPARGLPEAMPHRLTPRPASAPPAPAPAPARPPVRTFSDGEEEFQAPAGSVAGGPPGSVAGGPPPGWTTGGGSIMPKHDSTGAHPTLTAVSELEQPVMQMLAARSDMSLEHLHSTLRHSYHEHSNKTTTDLAAVLKNLVDQHKIVQDGEYYSLA